MTIRAICKLIFLSTAILSFDHAIAKQQVADNGFAIDKVPAPLAAQPLPYKYVGNTFSHKFHRPWCPFAKKMWAKRMQLFHFRKDAIESNFVPCNYCLPPVWVEVHACLKNRIDQQEDATRHQAPALP